MRAAAKGAHRPLPRRVFVFLAASTAIIPRAPEKFNVTCGAEKGRAVLGAITNTRVLRARNQYRGNDYAEENFDCALASPSSRGDIAAAQTPPPFATRKIDGTDNVYLFRYQGHQSMFIVTPKA